MNRLHVNDMRHDERALGTSSSHAPPQPLGDEPYEAPDGGEPVFDA